jgi:hypothetical protein
MEIKWKLKITDNKVSFIYDNNIEYNIKNLLSDIKILKHTQWYLYVGISIDWIYTTYQNGDIFYADYLEDKDCVWITKSKKSILYK